MGPSEPLCWFSMGGCCHPELQSVTSLPAPAPLWAALPAPGPCSELWRPHHLGALLSPSSPGSTSPLVELLLSAGQAPGQTPASPWAHIIMFFLCPCSPP